MREEKVARDADNENIIRVVWKRWSRAIGSICVELRNFARIMFTIKEYEEYDFLL